MVQYELWHWQEFIVEWTRFRFRMTKLFFFYRCGSVPGKYQSYPWFTAGEVHWCWNYWQTRQLHPCHSLQTTGNAVLSHDFESLSCTIIELTVQNDCNIYCGPDRWFYSWSCALWTSLTVCCWRASPLWSSYSKASPVIPETSFLRLVHSDLRPSCTGIYTASHPTVCVWTERWKCRPVLGVWRVVKYSNTTVTSGGRSTQIVK